MSQIQRSIVAALCTAACIVDESPTTETDAGTTATSTTATTGEPTTGTTGASTGTTGESTGTTGTGESTGTTADESMGATTGAMTCPGHAGVDDCCCFERKFDRVLNLCGARELCPPLIFNCDGHDGPCVWLLGAGDPDCALLALAGAEPGALKIAFNPADISKRWIEYFPLGDGTAYRIEHSLNDLDGDYEESGRFALQPASFFEQCLAGTLTEKVDCLDQALAGPATEVCVEAFSYSDI